MVTNVPFTKCAAAAVLLLAAAHSLHADDTEIYIGTSGVSEVRPNIVFVIDTSGSMATTVSEASDVYNPALIYPGTCATDKIYYGTGTAPRCDTNNWFNATANKCKAATNALLSKGLFQDRLAMWNNHPTVNRAQWVQFDDDWKDHAVECRADNGIDGDGARLWAANYKNGPWSSDNKVAVSWSDTGKVYTLYSGNFLNWKSGPGNTPKSRLDVVKEVFSILIDTTQDVNIALMRFDSQAEGGYFLTPMLPLTDTPIDHPDGGTPAQITSRDYFKGVIQSLKPNGNTPLAETMYEAGLYFRGAMPVFGDDASPSDNHPGVLDADLSYRSPVDYECQKNFIVYLTDGEPTSDGNADVRIRALPNFSSVTDTCGFSSDDCLDEVAQYLYESDQRADMNGVQNVITYTVGFHTDQTLLKAAAEKGGGDYYRADNTSNLLDAFTSIVTEILAINTSFAAPAVTVNAFNRLTHRSDLYFALFRPSERPAWRGNIKRYKLGGDPLVVRDATEAVAVDPNTGFFKANSQSFWNPGLVDGDDVSLGGAAGRLALPRKVYTNVSGDTITAASNALDENNSNISCTMVGLPATCTEAELANLLKWARGVDVFDDDGDGSTVDVRSQLGDPLHTQPVLVTYGANDMVLFGSTNEGYVHAIDSDDGSEIFAFMPKALLPNLYPLYENSPGTPHPYGMDGPLALWSDDVGFDGTIGAGDRVYLYASMRRGGRNIYALDVTNRHGPVLMWTIEGGAGSFSELGQTWSRPIVTKVKFAGSARTVLIFGGGYDDNQDIQSAGDDDVGRAIFMVDAKTGEKLWQAGPTAASGASLVLGEMMNSIPSEVRVLDIDANGIADRMYVGDMGGRIWRFDVNEENGGASDFATGGIVATLGQTSGESTDEHQRRFYYPPDVSINRDPTLLNIAIGSGYRAHPLNTAIHDRFFVLYDSFAGKTAYSPWNIGDLYSYESPSDDCGTKRGFYIDLNNPVCGSWQGEKVLAEALTLNHEVNFTTFTPIATGGASCAPSQGQGALYRVRIPCPKTCAELVACDMSGLPLDQPSIPPAPQLVCTEEGCTVLVGPQSVPDDGLSLKPIKDYWRKKR